MRLDVVGRLVTRHRPAVLPVAGWFDTPGLEPQLESFCNDDGTGPVCRGGDVDERDKFTGKRNGDLTEVVGSHTPTVSDHEARCKTPPRRGHVDDTVPS